MKMLRQKQTQEEYYRGVRMAPYDLVKELFLALAGLGILVLVLAAFLSSPDVPTVTIQQWANNDPVDFVTTATGELAGTTTSAGYGNPYNAAGGEPSWCRPCGIDVQGGGATPTARPSSSQYQACSCAVRR